MTEADEQFLQSYQSTDERRRKYFEALKNIEKDMLKDPAINSVFQNILNDEMARKFSGPGKYKRNKQQLLERMQRQKEARLKGTFDQ